VGTLADAPLVVAQRSDLVGSRLMAMVQASAVAEIAGLPFRFAWPTRTDCGQHYPPDIFTDSYLARHEISAVELSDRNRLTVGDLDALCSGTDDSGGSAFVEVSYPLSLRDLEYVDPNHARERAASAFWAMGWEAGFAAALEAIRRWDPGSRALAVHVRAGDIVFGDWRHIMQHDKYTPVPLVTAAIEEARRDGRTVVLFADNEQMTRWLVSRYPEVVVASDVLAERKGLTDLQRAVFDLVLMSRCREITGPPRSAFSGLAAVLGGSRVIPMRRLVGPAEAQQRFRAWFEESRRRPESPDFLDPLVAHDICWYVDVFGPVIGHRESIGLIEEACGLDPGFSALWSRKAVLLSMLGRHRAARRAAVRERQIARGVQVNNDPLVAALSTSVLVRCAPVLSGQIPSRSLDARCRRLMARIDRRSIKRLDPPARQVDVKRLRHALGEVLALMEPGKRTVGANRTETAPFKEAPLCDVAEPISLWAERFLAWARTRQGSNGVQPRASPGETGA
jgi:hypothetical protein